MKVTSMDTKIPAEHGVAASYPDQFFGYFGWPTVARIDDGKPIVASSGLRNYHVCPFGRTVICTSNDDGRTWTSPRVINDSPLDDRDVGIVSLEGRKLALAWFTTDNRGAPPTAYQQQLDAWGPARWQEGLASMTDEGAARRAGKRVSHR